MPLILLGLVAITASHPIGGNQPPFLIGPSAKAANASTNITAGKSIYTTGFFDFGNWLKLN